jgi:hypothetical protein
MKLINFYSTVLKYKKNYKYIYLFCLLISLYLLVLFTYIIVFTCSVYLYQGIWKNLYFIYYTIILLYILYYGFVLFIIYHNVSIILKHITKFINISFCYNCILLHCYNFILWIFYHMNNFIIIFFIGNW